LVLLDVTDPSAPREVTWRPTAAQVEDILVGRGRVYVQSSNEVQIFDVSDAARPRLVGQVPAEGVLALDGTRLYAGDLWHLAAYELSDPRQPRWLGEWSYPDGLSAPVWPIDIEVQGGMAWLTTQAGLIVADVRD